MHIKQKNPQVPTLMIQKIIDNLFVGVKECIKEDKNIFSIRYLGSFKKKKTRKEIKKQYRAHENYKNRWGKPGIS